MEKSYKKNSLSKKKAAKILRGDALKKVIQKHQKFSKINLFK